MAEYIDREAAIAVFESGEADVIEDYGDGCDFGFGSKNIKSTLNSIPAADVVPVVHGRWVREDEDCFYCTVCGVLWQTLDGETPENNDMKFCPCCGAKMDGGDDGA